MTGKQRRLYEAGGELERQGQVNKAYNRYYLRLDMPQQWCRVALACAESFNQRIYCREGHAAVRSRTVDRSDLFQFRGKVLRRLRRKLLGSSYRRPTRPGWTKIDII